MSNFLDDLHATLYYVLHHSPQQTPLEEIVHILEKSGVSPNTPSSREVFPQTPPPAESCFTKHPLLHIISSGQAPLNHHIKSA